VGASAQDIERVYRDRYLRFRNALWTVTGSYDAARDAVQEGFARALNKRSSFRGEAPLEAWIFKIALRAAVETKQSVREVPVEQTVEPQLPQPEHDPALAAALRELPPRRRLVIFLRYFADLTYSEIAYVCGISEGTVAATIAQAHEALLKQLDGIEVKR
jgi:RNA polymerase sigma-70 factor, ECF subfamily